MSANLDRCEVGKMRYFVLFGVGLVKEIVDGVIWVMFDGYRVAFDPQGHHLEVRIGV